jgi:hypothetical protein
MKPQLNRCDDRPPAAKAQIQGRIRMEILLAGCILALCCTSALADDDSREQVRVIGNEPARTSYGWQAPGRSAVACFSSGCSRLYAPSGTDNGAGAVLRLLRSDASIVVVQCKAQGVAPGAATQDANSSEMLRHCTLPDASYQVAAEFHPREVKLYMFAPGADGPGAISSDTYSILGVLVPTSSPQPVDPEPASAPSSPVSAIGISQAEVKPDGKMATPDLTEEVSEAPVRKSKSLRMRQQVSGDSSSSPALLTYLTHELIDPRKLSAAHPGLTAAQVALLSLGPVRPALEPQVPATEPLQQEPPQAVPTAQEQASLPQGQVDTAVATVPTASGPVLSAPAPLPLASQQAPLPEGPVDTALAPSTPASTIALSAPRPLPSAPAKAPLPEGPVDSALAPIPAASGPVLAPQAQAAPLSPPVSAAPAQVASAPEPVSPAPVQTTAAPTPVPPVQAQFAPAPSPAAPVQAQFAPLPPPISSAPAQLASAPEPVPPAPAQVTPSPSQIPPAQARVTPPPLPAPSPAAAPTRVQIAPAQPSIPAAQAQVTPAPPPAPSVQAQVASAGSPAPPTATRIYPAQRPAHQSASQFAVTDVQSRTALVRIDPETGAITPIARASAPAPEPDSQALTQIASAGAPPPLTSVVASGRGPALMMGDVGPSLSISPSDNPRFRRLDKKIAELDFPVQELAEQWAQFEKECPEPTTDAMCLDAKGKVIQSMQKVFESKIVLVDQKISILEAGPQDAFAQQEEADSKDIREKMKVALDRFPSVLVHLNKTLQDLRRANDDQ